MMLHRTTIKMDIYNTNISNLNNSFHMDIEMNKVDKDVLVTIEYPNYDIILREYPHLKGAKMNDHDQKRQLPIHMVLGASDYSKIKTETKPKIGLAGEPVAEFTKLGWTIMSPGKDVSSLLILSVNLNNCVSWMFLDWKRYRQKIKFMQIS